MDLVYLFLSQLMSILLLIVNSKLMQHNRVYLAMVNSFLITLAQYAFVSIIANSEFEAVEKIMASGVGGSCGVGLGYLLYTRFLHKGEK